MRVKDVKKVVLAYSGGLDTSVILRWLQTTYGCEVVTFTADLGQGEELEPARRKAEMLGIREIYVDDLRETFVRDVFAAPGAFARLSLAARGRGVAPGTRLRVAVYAGAPWLLAPLFAAKRAFTRAA